MSDTKHSSGKWEVKKASSDCDGFIIISEGRMLAIVEASSIPGHAKHIPTEKEALANANLMASAPDLLEALQGLVRYCEAVKYTAGMGENQLKRFEAAKVAILKATNKEELKK